MSAIHSLNNEIECRPSKSMHRVYKAVDKAIVVYICKRNRLARQLSDGSLVVFYNSIATGGFAPENRNADTVGMNALLLKELDETNNWARLGFQLYFGWFALQFTINGVAAGWVFTHTGPMQPIARWIFWLLIAWNLLGTATTFFLRNYFIERDQRITLVLGILTNHRLTSATHFGAQSPMHVKTIGNLFLICAGTMVVSLLFWITILVFWQ